MSEPTKYIGLPKKNLFDVRSLRLIYVPANILNLSS
jgi:hypothetical protein